MLWLWFYWMGDGTSVDRMLYNLLQYLMQTDTVNVRKSLHDIVGFKCVFVDVKLSTADSIIGEDDRF